MYANFKEEKLLWKQGNSVVVGLDEAGRGPLAGPVVAAAVSIASEVLPRFTLRDSKKLSEKQRNYFYKKLTEHQSVVWGVGIVSEEVIDDVNVLEATKLAMAQALIDLSSKFDGRHKKGTFDFLLLDGNFRIPLVIPQKSIIRGDSKVFSCAAAGIIAKVTRDRMMQEFHQKYPQYGFDRHKGYGTKLHIKNISLYGPCKIHRKSFFPISALVKGGVI